MSKKYAVRFDSDGNWIYQFSYDNQVALGIKTWSKLKSRLATQPSYLEECNIPPEDIQNIITGIERSDDEFLKIAVDDYLKSCNLQKGNLKKYTEAIFGNHNWQLTYLCIMINIT